MTVLDLVAELRHRGLELLVADGRLGVRPAGQLTPEERAALVARKAEVLALLRAEQRPARTEPSDRWTDDVPEDLCGLCGSPLAWVVAWPMAGEAPWLCPTCAAWPAPALAEVFAGLTAVEHQLLDAEASHGDALAVAVLRELRGDGRAA